MFSFPKSLSKIQMGDKSLIYFFKLMPCLWTRDSLLVLSVLGLKQTLSVLTQYSCKTCTVSGFNYQVLLSLLNVCEKQLLYRNFDNTYKRTHYYAIAFNANAICIKNFLSLCKIWKIIKKLPKFDNGSNNVVTFDQTFKVLQIPILLHLTPDRMFTQNLIQQFY